MDEVNLPKPKALSPTNKNSFAYKTIKDRLPVTITRAIDLLFRFRNEILAKFGTEDITEDIKTVIERLSGLRYELTTDKPLRHLTDTGLDVNLWNNAMDELSGKIGQDNMTWFKAPWLFTECYVYRRLRESLLLCESDLKFYDLYTESKKESYTSSESTIIGLIKALCPVELHEGHKSVDIQRQQLELILEVALWANKNDLSMSSGADSSDKIKNLIHTIEDLKPFLVANQSQLVLDEMFHRDHKRARLDIVLDNTGIELIADLILADFLLRNDIYKQVHLHFKEYSWFVSDATIDDYAFTIKQLKRVNSMKVDRLLKRIDEFKENERLIFKVGEFWTTPYAFSKMEKVDKELYHDLQKSDLILFKGDLNYRKLFADLDWPIYTPLNAALRNFKPASMVIVRTLKSDLVAGLDEQAHGANVNEIQQKNPNWMIQGDYGLIQFFKLH